MTSLYDAHELTPRHRALSATTSVDRVRVWELPAPGRAMLTFRALHLDSCLNRAPFRGALALRPRGG